MTDTVKAEMQEEDVESSKNNESIRKYSSLIDNLRTEKR